MTDTRSPGQDEDDAGTGQLEVGGHEPAPASGDATADEARGRIQDAFDDLGAAQSTDALWEAADRRADEAPAPGTPAAEGAATEPTAADATGEPANNG